jgi:hypothetical protein
MRLWAGVLLLLLLLLVGKRSTEDGRVFVLAPLELWCVVEAGVGDAVVDS